MDALREWMESDLDVIMVGTWLAHGCSAGMDGFRSGRYHGRRITRKNAVAATNKLRNLRKTAVKTALRMLCESTETATKNDE